MKKILYLLAVTVMAGSCANETPKETATEETPKADSPVITYDMPYKALYSSDWSIGDAKYTKMALDFYKQLENDSLASIENYFEDSIEFRSYDSRILKVSRDEIVSRVKAFRSKFSSLREEFPAFVCLHSNDRNEDWVSLWINEYGVYKNGKPDSTRYHENWRFRAGKVYFIADFARYKNAR